MAEVLDKKGQVIISKTKTVKWDDFIKVIKPFKKVMVGVGGGTPPFKYIFFEAKKREIIETVRMNRMKVTFSIMYNSKVRKNLDDVLYIQKMKTTLLDDGN